MSDLRQQVRDHYDAQSLSADKAAALLAVGRIAAPPDEKITAFPQSKPWGKWLAMIAALAVFAFMGIWVSQRGPERASYTKLAPRVIEFFDNKSPLVPAPQGQSAMREWLISKGAPSNYEMPLALVPLEKAACQVVEVAGRKTYMSCYWREQIPNRGDHELIHLLIARADDFKDQPKSAKPEVRVIDGWSFASWRKDDVLYTLATAAPPEKLAPFISSAHSVERSRFISSVLITR